MSFIGGLTGLVVHVQNHCKTDVAVRDHITVCVSVLGSINVMGFYLVKCMCGDLEGVIRNHIETYSIRCQLHTTVGIYPHVYMYECMCRY